MAHDSVDARRLALEVLLAVREKNAFVRTILDHLIRRHRVKIPDRRLATEISYGVLRRRLTLDVILDHLVQRGRERVEPWLWETLRLGAYQILFLTEVPVYAAIHATVELAGSYGKPRAKPFVNGILRSVARLKTDRVREDPDARALPLRSGTYLELAEPLFPDPMQNAACYYADAFSLPPWLAERWVRRWVWQECLRIGFYFIETPLLCLRINRLRTRRDEMLARLSAAGIPAEPLAHPQGIRLLRHVRIPSLPGFDEGWFTVQDASAMEAASLLAPTPGSRVLDLCAAPGGKATHLAELMDNRGEIIACDINAKRLEMMMRSCGRLGITCIRPHVIDRDDPASLPDGPFDYALVDAPCSNTGVIGKRPEVRWRIKPRDLEELSQMQRRLLTEAIRRTRSGGRVVYSTCSIEPEENEQVVTIVTRESGLTVRLERQGIPGKPGDGGYLALVESSPA